MNATTFRAVITITVEVDAMTALGASYAAHDYLHAVQDIHADIAPHVDARWTGSAVASITPTP